MSYTQIGWQNKPSTATPINRTNLNHMDAGIAANDAAIGTLQTAVSNKVDKVEGKGLSTNDFTDADALKLADIEDGAEINVQADWDEADNTADDYIKNKPDLSVYAEKEALWQDATASGNPVTIKTQSAQAAKQTILTMAPIQSGSGTPSPDNVRPISGRTQAEIKTFRKNMLPKDTISTGTDNGITYTVNSDGTISLSNTATDLSRKSGTFMLNKGRYIFTSGVAESFTTYDTYLMAGGSTIARGGIGQTNSFELSEPTSVSLSIRVRQGVTPNITIYPMIRSAEDADATFKPYVAPQTVTIPFGSTIYGGTLNVETGELTVDREIVDLGSLEWTKSTTDAFYSDGIKNEVKPTGTWSEKADLICTIYEGLSMTQVYTNHENGLAVAQSTGNYPGRLWAYDADKTSYTAEQFTTAMDGVKVVYKLNTPTTTTITAAQVNLLKGLNNVSTDADGISLTYFADGESLTDADNRITGVLGDFATIEGKTASQNYAIGDYLIFSDKFCKASAAIASGEALAIGTNLTQTTIGAELKAILAQS